ncbi:DEAD/DEAH box helicase [Streptomyces liangshanensis]|uniref:DEAD/DEAH box helicase n=1 Tax=Streptomyces liangshanensis TaxID=2717324 RepID=UPI0036D9CD5D
MSEKRPLRAHQVEAVEAIVRGMDTPLGGIPANGLRGTVVSACGTGKTLMAAHAALRIAQGGRILVLLPTLDLLRQTLMEWRAEGHTGPTVAVCSLDDDPALWAAGVRTTTNYMQLAVWHSTGPVTVFATYASLPTLARAFEGAYGQRLSPFDLAVVDEAHRTSGSMGKAWAAIHDQRVIPVARRLYFTATPRVWKARPDSWEVREGARDRLPEEMACSMDDVQVYGPVLFELGLADAISMGLLARYQILVVEVRDQVVTPERLTGEEGREELVRGQRLGALQAAVMRTAAEHDLNKTITFHHRTVEAEAFSTGLPAMAARMHEADPERYPADVWSGWLMGEHEAEERVMNLGAFERTAHRAFISNCKVLGEGVDCPAVDAVALLDPKGSPVDIVQAIGRALRQKPGAGKVASLLVPVFLDPDEDAVEDFKTSASYRPLVKVLNGLRAHDERAVEMLALPQENTPNGPIQRIGLPPEDGEEESRMLLRFSSPRDPAEIAEWVSLHVIDVERQDWIRGHAAARAYREREGHLRVPLGVSEGSYPLGRWIRRQRAAYAAGTISGPRAERLDRLGMVWSPADADWEDNLSAARLYFDLYGTLAAPRSAVVAEHGGGEEGPQAGAGRPVGEWLSNCRRKGALSPERAAQLAAIDPDWNPSWPVDWQRGYAALRHVVEGEDVLPEILPGVVTVGGVDVGRWLERQRAGWAQLVEGQRERLALLGVEPPALPAPAEVLAIEAAPRSGGRSAAWERGARAARQYQEREGDLVVARGHVEVVRDDDGQEHAVKLGVWLSNQRSRRASLPAERVAVLAELGAL